MQVSASAKVLAKGSQAGKANIRQAAWEKLKSQSQPPCQKCTAKEGGLSSSTGSLKPAQRHQATGSPSVARKTQSWSGGHGCPKLFCGQTEHQVCSARAEVAYAGVVAGKLATNKKSLVDTVTLLPPTSQMGLSTPTAKEAAQSAPVDSMESTIRRPAGPSSNRSFLRWLQGKIGGNGMAQMRGESLIWPIALGLPLPLCSPSRKGRVCLFTPTPSSRTGQ